MDRRIVTDEQELQLWRQASEVVSRARRGAIPFDLASSRLQAIIEGAASTEPAEKRGKKRDLAEEERQWWQAWYLTLGFSGIRVPKPAVSNREMGRLKKSASGLIYVPEVIRVFYKQLLTAVGQGNHWTVAGADREGIVWDDPPTGYWLKAELAPDCPRLGTPWDKLNRTIRLLALPEYAIAWHAVKARTGQMLDVRAWCWLATRYKFNDGQFGALYANELDGAMHVLGRRPERLENSYADGGGRAAEVVKIAS